MERTFAIIKPDAFAAGNAGKILARIYSEGFKVVGIKKLYLNPSGTMKLWQSAAGTYSEIIKGLQ